MDKVFKLRISYSAHGRYNATKIVTLFVVAPSADDAIFRVLSPDTISVEVIEAHPCLICKSESYATT